MCMFSKFRYLEQLTAPSICHFSIFFLLNQSFHHGLKYISSKYGSATPMSYLTEFFKQEYFKLNRSVDFFVSFLYRHWEVIEFEYFEYHYFRIIILAVFNCEFSHYIKQILLFGNSDIKISEHNHPCYIIKQKRSRY